MNTATEHYSGSAEIILSVDDQVGDPVSKPISIIEDPSEKNKEVDIDLSKNKEDILTDKKSQHPSGEQKKKKVHLWGKS